LFLALLFGPTLSGQLVKKALLVKAAVALLLFWPEEKLLLLEKALLMAGWHREGGTFNKYSLNACANRGGRKCRAKGEIDSGMVGKGKGWDWSRDWESMGKKDTDLVKRVNSSITKAWPWVNDIGAYR
jgi:hypothetical protein